MADFLPGAIGCSPYCIRHFSAIDRNTLTPCLYRGFLASAVIRHLPLITPIVDNLILHLQEADSMI